MSAPTRPWLNVVGIGDGGLESLGATARAIVEAGEILVGGERHLDMVGDHPGERLRWGCPLEATLDELEALRGRRVVVLASGDPMCFGVGELLVRRFDLSELRVLPVASAFSLACARLGWSLVQVVCLSVHSRPLATVRRHIAPGARLIVLSRHGTTPDALARMLDEEGFGPSRLWVFEHLDGPAERRIEGTAAAWQACTCAALNTVAIECIAGPGAAIRSRAPGLPDDVFESDGMITKRDVRAATLARLAPLAGQRLWDIGAGSGAIAIEWLRATDTAQAIAVEQDAGRCATIARNAESLGTPELTVVHARAPDCLSELTAPDAVFIGGGIREAGMLEACWGSLCPGGRLVANAVTVEGEQRLLAWQAQHGGELLRIDVARLDALGSYRAWRRSLPVTQLAAYKP
ncbi:MAG TPA: precorrin-6y C5,15-methyltransferase (decarboxylating) subunit CbiE [Geminicoccaceae bacterium]